MTEPILRLTGITKRFGSVTANEAVSFFLDEGEIVALLGENGAGKTTLMSILFGHYVADEGHIEVSGKPLVQGSPKASLEAGIGMVHQHFTLAGNMSALDNVMLGTESLVSLKTSRKAARKKLDRIMTRFGLRVDPNAVIKNLSVGEQQRVEILKVLYRDARILILDEPTAVLTPQESDALFETLSQLVSRGLSVIFITHKMREVMAASRRCVVLRQGRVVFESPTSATTPRELASAMVGSEVPRLVREERTPGSEILALKSISIGARQAGPSVRGLDLCLRSGEILGIAGVSGNGQALLADLVSGRVKSYSGEIVLNGKRLNRVTPRIMVESGVARVPDDRNGTGLIGDMTVMENLASETYWKPPFSRWGILRFRALSRRAAELVKRFDVRCPDVEIPVRKLSGGNMQKLILARELSGSPGIILANQPTWGLDVGAASYVHRCLMDAAGRGAGVILISEDLDELFQVADRIQVMCHGRLSEPEAVDCVDRAQLGLIMSGQQGIPEPSGERHAS